MPDVHRIGPSWQTSWPSRTALAILHEDSTRERALQVADAVAWVLFQKYERRDETFWEIIQENVVVICRP